MAVDVGGTFTDVAFVTDEGEVARHKLPSTSGDSRPSGDRGPDRAAARARMADSPTGFLLIANILLLVIGCFIETLPALLIVVPMLMPVAHAVGVDPVRFGVVVIFNLLIGIMTPPMGIGIYIMMAISEVRMGELVRACLPFLPTLLVALAILTYVPEVTLKLPRLLLH